MPRWALLGAAVVGQAVLARLLYLQPILVLPHAVALLGVIVWATLQRRADLTLIVVAYLTSAEVMWRQARGPIPAQLGPYLAILAAVLTLLTAYPHLSKIGRKVLLYAALLLPSSLITIAVASGTARQAISFALAGPVALAALVAWLSQVQITRTLYRRILWAMVISGVGPLTIAVTNIRDYIGSGKSLGFRDQANFVASGGFGPVQVSSVLGLTAMVALLLALAEPEIVPRLLAIAIGVGAGAQSLLTFSRGGMTATALALGALAVSQTRNRETRRRVFAAILILFTIGWVFVIPRIDGFTQGKFNKRFSDTSSGRTELAANDVQIFRAHPAFGVGPGMTKYQRLDYESCRLRVDRCASEASSHTEFTRMLGEHGVAGVLAIGVMASLVVDAIRRAGPSRGITISFMTWAVAQMFYANMRVVAVSIAFAFAFLLIRGPTDDDGRAPSQAAPAHAVQ